MSELHFDDFYDTKVQLQYGDECTSKYYKRRILSYLNNYHIITENTLTGPTDTEYKEFDDYKDTKYLTPLDNYLRVHNMKINVTVSEYGAFDVIYGLYDVNYFKNKFDTNDYKIVRILTNTIAWYDERNDNEKCNKRYLYWLTKLNNLLKNE